MTTYQFYSLGTTLLLVSIHLFTHRLRFTEIPRSKWLSFAGGVSVAYVFVHLLPELEEWQSIYAEAGGINADFLAHHLYIVTLTGLVLFYGLERTVKRKQEPEEATENPVGIFWVHIASFAMYNFLIGYLLVHREEKELSSLWIFFLAMGAHFIVNDCGLIFHHQKIYVQKGRWLVSLATLAGWLLGIVTSLHELFIAALFAFLAGGVILNVMKEELPAERKSNFTAFLVGAASYTLLLIGFK